MAYYSETQKARELIPSQFLEGTVIDIGCGSDKIISTAIGIDGRQLDGVDFVTDAVYGLSGYNIAADCLYSSHLLEHLTNPTQAIQEWQRLILRGGYFILYLPDKRGYSNVNNPEHMFDWDMQTFEFYFRRVWCGEGKDFNGNNLPPYFKLISIQEDFRPDCYSFLLIAQKL